MADDETTSTEITTAGGGEVSGSSPLQTPHGSTTIADGVVAKVAGIAAREVPGVHSLGSGAGRAFGAVTRSIGIGDDRTQGVSVEVGEREAAVDLVLIVDYGESIPQVTEHVRTNVIERIEGITGLRVNEVNIAVSDLYFPGEEQETPPARVS